MLGNTPVNFTPPQTYIPVCHLSLNLGMENMTLQKLLYMQLHFFLTMLISKQLTRVDYMYYHNIDLSRIKLKDSSKNVFAFSAFCISQLSAKLRNMKRHPQMAQAAVRKFCLFVSISVWRPGIAAACGIIFRVWVVLRHGSGADESNVLRWMCGSQLRIGVDVYCTSHRF